MSLEKVQQGLIKRFNDTFGTPWAGRLAWENIAFTATPGQPWMSFYFMPVQEDLKTLGPDGYDEANGLVQIDVNYPIGVGEGEIRKTINELRTCFKPQPVTYDSQGITILSRSRAGGITSNGFYKVPFSVRWRALITRNL